jgi:cathepsin L
MKILSGLTLAIVGVVAAAAVLMNAHFADSSANFLETSDAAFNRYIAKHGKSYANKNEYMLRKTFFEKAQEEVNAHNSQNGVTWIKALNQFSDMTPEEIKRHLGGGRQGENRTQVLAQYPASSELLEQASQYVDWRGQMNPVRDQGSCGSCWAFATVAATEGRYTIKYGNKLQFSEQQLIDCTRDCYGCDGGWVDRGLNYLRYNGAM